MTSQKGSSHTKSHKEIFLTCTHVQVRVIYPRHTRAARVTVVVLSVCVCVCVCVHVCVICLSMTILVLLAITQFMSDINSFSDTSA